METEKIINVVILDSSEETAKLFAVELSKKKDINIIGFSNVTTVAYDLIKNNQVDVLLLDIDMNRLVGLEFLTQTMQYTPLPIVTTHLSTQKGKINTINSFEHGAIDFFPKSSSFHNEILNENINELYSKIKISSTANIVNLKKHLDSTAFQNYNNKIAKFDNSKIFIFGVGIGNLELFRKLVINLPPDFPCILAVTDLAQGYSKAFADRLNEIHKFIVKESNEGDELASGKIIIAPGGFHMKIEEDNSKFYLSNVISEKVNHKRPSLDILMFSAAEYVGKNTIGVLLGSVGIDGVLGMKSLKLSGGKTFALNPKEAVFDDTILKAVDFGGVDVLVNYDDLLEHLINVVKIDNHS